LKEYLRSQGRSEKGEISLNDQDIRELLDRNATLQVEDRKGSRNKVIRSNSRLAEALIDPSVKWDKRASNKRYRSNSLSSITDEIVGINQYGKAVVISPRNIKLTLDTSDVLTSTDDERRRHFKAPRNRYYRNARSLTDNESSNRLLPYTTSNNVSSRRRRVFQTTNRTSNPEARVVYDRSFNNRYYESSA